MAPSYLLAIDAGSHGVRCLLLNTESGKTINTYRPWKFNSVTGMGGWGFDMDLDRVWRNVVSVIKEILQREQEASKNIAGIAVTAMRFSTVVLDEHGIALFSVPNRDARAVSHAIDLADEKGEFLLQRTGCWPTPISLVSRLLFLQAESPDLLTSSTAVMSLGDWITMRLSGRISSDPTQASGSQLINLESREWAWDVIEEFQFPKESFPDLLNPGELQGSLKAEAAHVLGIPSGIPIAVGGGDTQTGLIGIGAIEPGDVGIVAGSTTPIQWVLQEPLVDVEGRMWTGHHSLPHHWVLESNIGGTGEALEWFAQVLFPESKDPITRYMVEGESAPTGAGGIISSMGSQLFNARDMSFPIENMSYSHFVTGSVNQRRALFARAGLESMAYGTRLNLAQLKDVVGEEPSRLIIGGGQTRSTFFTQILCNALGMEIEVGPIYASALGAALCAGVGIGLYEDLVSAIHKVQPLIRTHKPVSEQNQYEEHYARWKQHRTATQDADQIAASGVLEVISQLIMDEGSQFNSVKRKLRTLVTAEMDSDTLRELENHTEVVYAPYREEMRILTDEDLVEALRGFDIFVTEVDLVDAQVLRQSPQLRVVVSCRGNPTNVDQEACTLFGIPLLHTPGRNADAVADLTVAFMIILSRKLPQAVQFLKEPGAEAGDLGRRGQAHFQFQGDELTGKTVGIVGLGKIGGKVAQRLSAFRTQILAYDPFLSPIDAHRMGAELVTLEELLSESDFVSLHVPVTESTRGMVDQALLKEMKKGAFLINTARGALIDENALIDALNSGHLSGAGLDVFDVEPPGSNHPLLALEQVIATPHIGGNTYQIGAHQGKIVVQELSRLLEGNVPENIRNPEVLETFDWETQRGEVEKEVLDALIDRPTPQVSDTFDEVPKPTPGSPSDPSTDPQKPNLLKGLKKIMGAKPQKPTSRTVDLDAIKVKMEAILEEFIDQVGKDEGLREFAMGRQVSMHYHLKDLDLHFFTIFDDGTVQGGVGPPDKDMDVTLRMKAELLDGMFTGRTNPTRAAMTGKLSFSGDTKKAMSLQKVQKELLRLYQSAREKIGDPGDLSGVPDYPPTIEPASPTAEPKPSPPASKISPAGDVRDDLIEALNELYAARLITSTGGNISARVEGENTLWITPSQLFKGNLNPSMMVEIDMEGNPIDPEARSPSSEKMLHCAILRDRQDLNVVIHTHAPKATSLALAELPFLPISTEAAFVGEIPRVPFIMPGTIELAEAAANALGEGVAVLMQNHGLVVAASNMRRAIDLTLIIEQTSEKILSCYAVGKEPPVLPEGVVEELKSIGRMMV